MVCLTGCKEGGAGGVVCLPGCKEGGGTQESVPKDQD